MTDGICQFFPGRLRPPRQTPQLIDDTHESTHERSSAPFCKAKKLRRAKFGFLIFVLDSFLIETRLCPRLLAPTLVVTPVRLGPFYVAHPIRSIHSLVSLLALRYPRGVTVHVARP